MPDRLKLITLSPSGSQRSFHVPRIMVQKSAGYDAQVALILNSSLIHPVSGQISLLSTFDSKKNLLNLMMFCKVTQNIQNYITQILTKSNPKFTNLQFLPILIYLFIFI